MCDITDKPWPRPKLGLSGQAGASTSLVQPHPQQPQVPWYPQDDIIPPHSVPPSPLVPDLGLGPHVLGPFPNDDGCKFFLYIVAYMPFFLDLLPTFFCPLCGSLAYASNFLYYVTLCSHLDTTLSRIGHMFPSLIWTLSSPWFPYSLWFYTPWSIMQLFLIISS